MAANSYNQAHSDMDQMQNSETSNRESARDKAARDLFTSMVRPCHTSNADNAVNGIPAPPSLPPAVQQQETPVEFTRCTTRLHDNTSPEGDIGLYIMRKYPARWQREHLDDTEEGAGIYQYRLAPQEPPQRVVHPVENTDGVMCDTYLTDVYTVGGNMLCLFVDYNEHEVCIAHWADSREVIEGLLEIELGTREFMKEEKPADVDRDEQMRRNQELRRMQQSWGMRQPQPTRQSQAMRQPMQQPQAIRQTMQQPQATGQPRAMWQPATRQHAMQQLQAMQQLSAQLMQQPRARQQQNTVFPPTNPFAPRSPSAAPSPNDPGAQTGVFPDLRRDSGTAVDGYNMAPQPQHPLPVAYPAWHDQVIPSNGQAQRHQAIDEAALASSHGFNMPPQPQRATSVVNPVQHNEADQPHGQTGLDQAMIDTALETQPAEPLSDEFGLNDAFAMIDNVAAFKASQNSAANDAEASGGLSIPEASLDPMGVEIPQGAGASDKADDAADVQWDERWGFAGSRGILVLTSRDQGEEAMHDAPCFECASWVEGARRT